MPNSGVANRIAGTLYPPDHPIYEPCQLSLMGLMMAVDTAWSVGYQRGFTDGATSAPPRTIVKRVTVTKAGDKAAILKRIRQLAAATETLLSGKAGVLVDLGKTQRTVFQCILDDLAAFDTSESEDAVAGDVESART